MKKRIFLIAAFFAFGSFAYVSAQNTPGVPNGSVAKDSRDEYDKGIRLRSIELERVRKENNRAAAIEKAIESRKLNYSQIKNDFERIQTIQSAIVKTYVTGRQINYKRIGELAFELNQAARRLDENLLLAVEKADKKSSKKEIQEAEQVSDLIVVLDRAIGKFATNPIFKNLNVIEPKSAEKAEFELQNIVRLSSLLAREAEKQK